VLGEQRLTFAQPHPAKLTAKPHLLHQLMLLPRDNLPLSALDLSQPHGELPASRLFDSEIKILDLEGRLGSNVLLARSEASHAIYAVEREGSGLYVLCKLGSWVDIEALSRKATVVCSERVRNSRPPRPDATATQPLITPQMHKENKKRRLCIEEIQSMVRRRPTFGTESQSRPSTPIIALPGSEALDSQGGGELAGLDAEPTVDAGNGSVPTAQGAGVHQLLPAAEDESIALPTAEDIFQNIRTQYLEALYHSMVC